MELERARRLTQELNRDKAEASSELTEAKRVSARARDERELAHQQSMEAEKLGFKAFLLTDVRMAAYEAMKACEAADEDRKKAFAAKRC